VLELDLKPFGAHQPKISLQSHIGNGVSFLNKTLSAKLFSPNANAEGRCAAAGQVAGGVRRPGQLGAQADQSTPLKPKPLACYALLAALLVLPCACFASSPLQPADAGLPS
jgi:hypothetical protein